MAEAKAHLRYLRIAPRKVRLVADHIRGKNLKEAERQLNFLSKKSALPILKLLLSAKANAKNNLKMNDENLYIKEIRVDQGPVFKRYMPRAQGRASMIRKKTSHITLILAERESGKSEVRNPKSQTNLKL